MNEKYTTYHIYSPGLYYSSSPTFLSNGELSSKQGFSSLYGVSIQDKTCIEQAGTTKGFKGSVWNERLWIDVDSYQKAEEVETILKQKGLDYVAYDSGGRGAHFGILRSTEPSHVLPQQDRKWVEENLPGDCFDPSIYTHLHLFRLPGTIHNTTGKPKELVTQQGGASLVLPKYKDDDGTTTFTSTDYSNPGVSSVFDNFMVMSQTSPAENGSRHPSLVRLAFALRDAETPVEVAQWWLKETNKMFREPKGEQEIEKIVRDVYIKG